MPTFADVCLSCTLFIYCVAVLSLDEDACGAFEHEPPFMNVFLGSICIVLRFTPLTFYFK